MAVGDWGDFGWEESSGIGVPTSGVRGNWLTDSASSGTQLKSGIMGS